MDAPRFDALTRLVAHAPSRRALLPLLPLLGSVLAAPLLGVAPAVAKKKKKKKTTLCLDGQTIQASKKKKKKLIKSGATPGACTSPPPPPPPPPGCTPNCPGNTCGGDDGCGGICGCAAGSLCQGGVCHACTLSCTGSGVTCGNDLKTALALGGTIYACPGRYVGSFTIDKNVTLIGAGEGDVPATNTILDANQNGRVVLVNSGFTALLHGLRITGGNDPNPGAGMFNQGTLTLTACTVTSNHNGSSGGAIMNAFGATGPLTLNACTISENSSGDGGGIFNVEDSTLTINGSAITRNDAVEEGGGIFNEGTVTFDSASSVTDNIAVSGGGIFNLSVVGGTVTLNGATVSGNTPNNCVNVPTCIG